MAQTEQKAVKKSQKGFSVAEICRIIELSHKNGVSNLKLGDIEVSFHTKEPRIRNKSGSERKPDLPETKSIQVTTSRPVVAQPDGRMTPRGFTISPEELEEYRKAQILIDDPVAYENAEIDAALHGETVTMDEDERYS